MKREKFTTTLDPAVKRELKQQALNEGSDVNAIIERITRKEFKMTEIIFEKSDTTETLRVAPGIQHDPYRTHYAVSEGQAKKVRRLIEDGFAAPSGVSLYIAPNADRCPHCVGAEKVL